MTFQDFSNNNHIVKHFTEAFKTNRIGGSYLFTGNNNSPKLSLALSIAQYICCENKQKEDSCQTCSSCVKYKSLTHPDLHMVFPVLQINKIKKPTSDDFILEFRDNFIKNPNMSLSDWFDVFSRENKSGKTGYIYTQEFEKIHSKLSLKNYEANYRFIIVWMPEKMQQNTSNKFLKILEEPPEKTVFILVSEHSEKLLKTITSRLQVFRIKENVVVQKKESLLDNGFDRKEKYFEDFQKWMRFVYAFKIYEITEFSNKKSKEGRNEQIMFLEYSLKMIQNCLRRHLLDGEMKHLTKKENDFLSNFHKFIHENNILEITKKLEESLSYIERNGNFKIIFYTLSLQLIKLLKVKRKFVA